MVQLWTIEISQLQFVLGGRCPYCQVVQVVHIPVVAHMRLLMVQTLCQTIDIHQLLTRWSTSLLCMIERDPQVPSWRRQSSSHDCTRCGFRRVEQLIIALMS